MLRALWALDSDSLAHRGDADHRAGDTPRLSTRPSCSPIWALLASPTHEAWHAHSGAGGHTVPLPSPDAAVTATTPGELARFWNILKMEETKSQANRMLQVNEEEEELWLEPSEVVGL